MSGEADDIGGTGHRLPPNAVRIEECTLVAARMLTVAVRNKRFSCEYDAEVKPYGS